MGGGTYDELEEGSTITTDTLPNWDWVEIYLDSLGSPRVLDEGTFPTLGSSGRQQTVGPGEIGYQRLQFESSLLLSPSLTTAFQADP